MAPGLKEIGLQTFCFRLLKGGQEITPIKECGVTTVELAGRAHGGGLSDEAAFEKTLAQYTQAGIKIVSAGVQIMTGKPEIEEMFFRCVKRAGAKYMSITFEGPEPECWRVAERLADKYDILLAIHNHGRQDRFGSSWMLQELFSKTSPRIGLCLDTAWALDAGEDPAAMVEQFAPRLYGLHLKDFIFDRTGKRQDIAVGTGNLDLAKLRQALDKVNFAGYTVLEFEGDKDNPLPAVKKCLQDLRQVFAG